MPVPLNGPGRLFFVIKLRSMMSGLLGMLFEIIRPATLFWITLLRIWVPAILGPSTIPAPNWLALAASWTVKPSITALLAVTWNAVVRPPAGFAPLTMVSKVPRPEARASIPDFAPRRVTDLLTVTNSLKVPALTTMVWPFNVRASLIAAWIVAKNSPESMFATGVGTAAMPRIGVRPVPIFATAVAVPVARLTV